MDAASESNMCLEKITTEKAGVERDLKSLQTSLIDLQSGMEEIRRHNGELLGARQKVSSENRDLRRSLTELETKTVQ